MSKIELYGILISPPVRACLLTLKALELDYVYKNVDMMKLEHLSEEFIKHNPQHTVPVLNDNGFWIWDSHAICGYLVSKYGKTDSLYPKDLALRAVVDQRMYFDASVLFMSLRNIMVPIMRKNITVVMKDKTESVVEGYKFLETFLGDNEYVTGANLTIADFCCCATISQLRAFIDIDMGRYPKIYAWLERLSKLPYYEEANGEGSKMAFGFIKSKVTEVIV